MRQFLILLTAFVGIGAVIGLVMMIVDPTGVMFGMDTLLALMQEHLPWPEVFFRNLIFSGITLLLAVGMPHFIASWLLIKKKRNAYKVSLLCGIVLMAWCALEWWMWGFNFLSNLFFGIGFVEVLTAIYKWLNLRRKPM